MNCKKCEGHGEWMCGCFEGFQEIAGLLIPVLGCQRCEGRGYMVCHTCNGSGRLEE